MNLAYESKQIYVMIKSVVSSKNEVLVNQCLCLFLRIIGLIFPSVKFFNIVNENIVEKIE